MKAQLQALKETIASSWFFQDGRHLLIFGWFGIFVLLFIAGMIPIK